jgi:hypothetical protein
VRKTSPGLYPVKYQLLHMLQSWRKLLHLAESQFLSSITTKIYLYSSHFDPSVNEVDLCSFIYISHKIARQSD